MRRVSHLGPAVALILTTFVGLRVAAFDYWAGFLDESVDTIFYPHNGTYQDISGTDPPRPLVISRPLTLVGEIVDGWPTYLNVSARLQDLPLPQSEVGPGGSLTLRNLFYDNSFVATEPSILKFTTITPYFREGTSLTVENVIFGDAHCVDWDDSVAMPILLKYTQTWATNFSMSRVNERAVVVHETGRNTDSLSGVTFRNTNTTFMCTGGLTQPWPQSAQPQLQGGGGGASTGVILAIVFSTVGGVALLAAVVAVLAQRQRAGRVVRAKAGESAEAALARSRGIGLEGLLGRGTFGKVYKGTWRGKAVAMKFLEFSRGDRQLLRTVARECAMAQACTHPSFVQALCYFSVVVRHAQPQEVAGGDKLVSDKSLGPPPACEAHAEPAEPQHSTASSMSHRLLGVGSRSVSERGSTCSPGGRKGKGWWRWSPFGKRSRVGEGSAGQHSGGAARGSGRSSSSSSGWSLGYQGVGRAQERETVFIVVVMQYMPGGTLATGIRNGMFRRPADGYADLRAVYATALDVARGVAHMHSSMQAVHRDLSAHNVLLEPCGSDSRGFRARIADFGLSAVIDERQTHRTSQTKGTLDYMPPEVFKSDRVLPALDIYSLGILLYTLYMGRTPYTGLSQLQVMATKLQQHSPLELPADMPPPLQALILECTSWDPSHRPTAAQVTDCLRQLLLQQEP